ncbi:MAG TPA: ring-cleaving dioxygenase [Candidatus Dormibacteraeota bacterium]
MPAAVPGIHHVTSITGDVQKNVDFYLTVLGLRFIKKSINQDVPDTYHLYFGDYLGSPGTAMTFFGWSSWPKRRAGSGQVTTVAFTIPEGSVDFWANRLRKLGVHASRSRRFDGEVLTLADPDGIELDLVPGSSELSLAQWRDGPVAAEHAIHGFHSVAMTLAESSATVDFLTKTMGFREKGREGNRIRFETGDGGPDSILDVVESPEGPVGEESIGTVHHVAWRAPDDARQQEWRDLLVAAGRNVTPVIDRWYFKSIYYREPGGVLFEIATDSPGFTIDERPEALGSSLSLPPWFQVRRDKLDETLTPLVIPPNLVPGRVSSV